MKRTILFFVTITWLITLTLLAPPPARAAGILYTVNSLDDVADFTDGVCTLREAILSSNGGVLTNCGPASADEDEIEFAVSGTITLDSDLPAINGILTIGGSNVITISGNDLYRIFTVNGGKTLTLKDITLTLAHSDTEGAAIRSFGSLYITNTKFVDNQANAGGGAIYSFSIADISGSEFNLNTSATGGAIMNPGIMALNSVKFQENNADVQSSGGAIWSSGPLTISASEFRKNKAGKGGAIHARRDAESTTLSIGSSLFEENLGVADYPDGNGGALLLDDLAATISTSTFSKNGAQSGGAIHITSLADLTLNTSTLRDNSQTTNGAGIYNTGKATVNQVTFSGNNASHGGAIDNWGLLFLTNVTLSGNQADYGGGLKNEGGTARLSNVTLFGNSAYSGGGILNTNPSTSLNLTNVIVANSPTGGNCALSTTPALSQFNLSSDNTCDFGNGRNNVNLMLNPLANNGGYTLTHLPKYGSPAIDKGTDDDAPSIDQRGILRPQGTFYDVGSVEMTPCTAKPTGLKLKKPGDKATLTNSRPTLRWSAATCAKTYKVVVKNAATGKVAFQKGALKVLKYQPDDPLPKGATYKWFVKACNPDAPSASRCAKSQTYKFTL